LVLGLGTALFDEERQCKLVDVRALATAARRMHLNPFFVPNAAPHR